MKLVNLIETVTIEEVKSLITIIGHKNSTRIVKEAPIVLEVRSLSVQELYVRELVHSAEMIFTDKPYIDKCNNFRLPNRVIGYDLELLEKATIAYKSILLEEPSLLNKFKKQQFITVETITEITK